jgi:hypothetical protein
MGTHATGRATAGSALSTIPAPAQRWCHRQASSGAAARPTAATTTAAKVKSNGVFFRAPRYLSNGKNKLTICQDRLGTHRRRTFAFTQESVPQRCAYVRVEYSFGVALDPELPGTEGGVFQSFKTIGAD